MTVTSWRPWRLPWRRRLPDAVRASRGCLLVLLGLAAAIACERPAAAQDFSNFYIFGGSYSDAGTYVVGGQQRRWTINPAQVWDQRLGSELGFNIRSNETIDTTTGAVTPLGGTNYAQGGARVSQLPGAYVWNDRAVQDQVDAYLASSGGRADPNALYSLEGGGNDIFYQAEQVDAGSSTIAQALVATSQAAVQFADIARELTDKGARYIFVLGVHDIANTPVLSSYGAVAKTFIRSSSKLYNDILLKRLLKYNNGNIIYIDMYHFLDELIANPTAYGFTNSTTPACSTAQAIDCTTATITPGASASTYLFSDDVHPSGPGHLALSEYIMSILVAPHQIAQLAETPIYAARATDSVVDGRFTDLQKDGTNVYSGGGYRHIDVANQDWQPGVAGDVGGGYVGVDYGKSGRFRFGALYDDQRGNYDFGNSSGSFGMQMRSVTVYAAFDLGLADLLVSNTIGSLSDYDVTRTFAIYKGSRSNSGATSGTYMGRRVELARDIAAGKAIVRPILGLSYQRASIDGYTETQSDSSTMSFGSQARTLLYATAGGQVTYPTHLAGHAVTPYLRVLVNDDLKRQDRTVSAGLVNARGLMFSEPVTEPNPCWWQAETGVRTSLMPGLDAGATVGATYAAPNNTSYWGNLSLSFAFN